MTITAEELFRGIRGDAYASREIDYLVTGTGGDVNLELTDAISAAAVAAPAEIAGTDDTILVQGNASLSRIIRNDLFIVTVQYVETGIWGIRSEKPTGNTEYGFSYQAPAVRVYQSLQTIGVYSSSATWSSSTFGGAIGVQRNADGSHDVEGVDTGPGSTTNTWSYTLDSIPGSYEVLVERFMGCVNSISWRGRPAGSMRFVQCNSQQTPSGRSTIHFGFQYAENATNIAVGSITVPAKDGHDYLWVYRDLQSKTVTGSLKLLLPSPQVAVVDRIFRRENFAQLGF